MRFDSTYGKDWLLITEKRIIAFNQNGVLGHNIKEVSLDSVEDIEILEMYGNNILKITTTDNAIELARYSKKLAQKFNLAVSELEELSQNGSSPTDKNERRGPGGRRGRRRPGGKPGADKSRCDKCGQPIPSWSGICVNCVQNRKLIFRLLKYSFPYLHVIIPAFLLMLVIRFVTLYTPILSQQLIDHILTPVANAITNANPDEDPLLPVTTWGPLQGTVDMLGDWFGPMPAGGSFGHLIGIVLLMASIHVFSMLTSSVRGYMMAWVGQNVTRRLQNEAYEHLNALFN